MKNENRTWWLLAIMFLILKVKTGESDYWTAMIGCLILSRLATIKEQILKK